MRIPLETYGEYSDRLCKAWGPFEFNLLIRLDGLVVANAEANKKSTPGPQGKGAATVPEPEVIKMDNSAGLRKLIMGIGAAKFGRKSEQSD